MALHPIRRGSFWLIVLFGLFLPPSLRAAESAAKVYVILWFDTEDYLLPASDDAALHLAKFLSGEDIRATFKVVGEKARTLEKRKRGDVIAALKKHEIGYHSNCHSVQPSPALYLSQLGWDEGVREFDRREGPGRADVERIFGQTPSCYGQPGSSWGPQSYGGMRKWGMKVYLDAGNHVNLNDRPCYYCGTLNLYKLAPHPARRPEQSEGVAASGGAIRAGTQGTAGRGRRRGQHLLSPLRVRPQEVLGRRQLFARRQPAAREMEAAARQDGGGNEQFLSRLRGLHSFHQALSRRAFHHGVRGGEAVPRSGRAITASR